MPPANFPKGPRMNDNTIDEVELARLGVQRVKVETFTWGGYRYSNARDAIAAAKRGDKK